MDSIIIQGGKTLNGVIKISGSKNASLPIMAACLLTPEKIILQNIPKLADVHTMQLLLENHGASVRHENNIEGHCLVVDCSGINNFTAPYDIVRKMRASIWVLGPLLARFGSASVSLPGGCAIGTRQVDLHLKVLEAMGASIEISNGYINAYSSSRLKGAEFNFDKVSVGATVNGILAAVLADGESKFFNCAIEPEIVDVCNLLGKMGAEIYGIGTSSLRIIGKEKLNGTQHKVIPDRIEAGTYMIAAAMTMGNVRIAGISYDLIENLAIKMKEAGISVTENSDIIEVAGAHPTQSVDISTQVYPGFATDLQAQFMTLMTIAKDTSIITENIFENRFMHVPELCRMGANITTQGHSAIVRGVEKLRGAEVMASDLRASVSLVIAGLAAEGYTKVRRVYHLDRGYENLVEKLRACGADIERITD